MFGFKLPLQSIAPFWLNKHFLVSGQLFNLETKGSLSQNGVVLAAPHQAVSSRALFDDVALGEAEDALSNKLRNHTSRWARLRDGTRIQNTQTIFETTCLRL